MLRVCTMIGCVALSAAWAAADTATFTPSKDNTLYQSDPASDLSNGQGAHLFVGVTSGGRIRRALVAFDISAIPAGSSVTGATLTMFMDRTAALSADVSLHRLTADWGEGLSNAGEPGGSGTLAAMGDATWNYSVYNTVHWAAVGGDYAPAVSSATAVSLPGASYTWGAGGGLVSDVQAWVDAPASNHGWIMIGDESGLGAAMRFDSREGVTPPVLTVMYTPPAHCGSADFNCDNDIGTDADIEAFFACLAGSCPAAPCTNSADFNADGDIGTDADIEAFFRVLAGGNC